MTDVKVEQVDRDARKVFFKRAGLRLSGDHLDMAEQAADEAFAKHRLAALDRPVVAGVPEGWVLVPRDPDDHQKQRGAFQVSGMTREGARCVYSAMLAAAPSPPIPTQAADELVAFAEMVATWPSDIPGSLRDEARVALARMKEPRS